VWKSNAFGLLITRNLLILLGDKTDKRVETKSLGYNLATILEIKTKPNTNGKGAGHPPPWLTRQPAPGLQLFRNCIAWGESQYFQSLLLSECI
jgi:hypothetical protein